MPITEYAIRTMGFTLYDPPKELTISKYYCLKIYSIVGIYYDTQDDVAVGELNKHCKFGIGNDLSKICLKLTGDKLNTDIEKLADAKLASSAYLITLTTTNLESKILCKWLMDDENKVITYDSLASVNQDLNSLVRDYEIAYIPLITSSLTQNDQFVKIILIETIRYGVLNNGKYLINQKLEVNANLSLAHRQSVNSNLNSIIELKDKYISPGESVSRLMYDSMQESDIEAFLYSWTAIEIFVNKEFPLNKGAQFPEIISSQYVSRAKKLFNDPDRGREITTVAHKFLYLSIYVWKVVNLQDYDDFIHAKKLRDEFIHSGKAIDSKSMTNLTIRLLYIINKIISQNSITKPG